MYNATYYTCLDTYLCIKIYTNNKVLGDRYPYIGAKSDLPCDLSNNRISNLNCLLYSIYYILYFPHWGQLSWHAAARAQIRKYEVSFFRMSLFHPTSDPQFRNQSGGPMICMCCRLYVCSQQRSMKLFAVLIWAVRAGVLLSVPDDTFYPVRMCCSVTFSTYGCSDTWFDLCALFNLSSISNPLIEFWTFEVSTRRKDLPYVIALTGKWDLNY